MGELSDIHTDLYSYEDFNCPFSYALNERLGDLAAAQVERRMIQHAPTAHMESHNVPEQADLANEVFTVRHRAPEIPISLPPGRPNTGYAIQLAIAAAKVDRGKADSLRTSIYHSLWIEGDDISDPEILKSLVQSNGLPWPLVPEEDVEQQLERWQDDWEMGNFEQRIPSLASKDGRVLLGLNSKENIKSFLNGQEVSGKNFAASSFHPRQIILLISELHDMWPFVRMLRDHVDIMVAPNVDEAINVVESVEPPDLIVLDVNLIGDQGSLFSHRLGKVNSPAEIPLLFFGKEDAGDDTEIQAYESGASFYFANNRNPDVVKAQITRLLRQKKEVDRLAHAANIDIVTSLFTRREFNRVIELEWLRGVRSKRPLSMMMLDIDKFKSFNDRYGHTLGDDCLRQISECLRTIARQSLDIVVRYGGEEYAIILPDTHYEGVMSVAERIQKDIKALALPHQDSGVKPYITLSIGVAVVIPSEGANPTTLIEAADNCLYRSKREGRNCIVGSDLDKTA